MPKVTCYKFNFNFMGNTWYTSLVLFVNVFNAVANSSDFYSGVRGGGEEWEVQIEFHNVHSRLLRLTNRKGPAAPLEVASNL
jgi:hypothetical protein